jgi:hypothetical protein
MGRLAQELTQHAASSCPELAQLLEATGVEADSSTDDDAAQGDQGSRHADTRLKAEQLIGVAERVHDEADSKLASAANVVLTKHQDEDQGGIDTNKPAEADATGKASGLAEVGPQEPSLLRLSRLSANVLAIAMSRLDQLTTVRP